MLCQQCSDHVKAKLQARKDFLTIKNDPVVLLKAIKQHCLSHESSQCKMQTLLEAMKNWINLKQKENEPLVDYLKRAKAAREAFLSQMWVWNSVFHELWKKNLIMTIIKLI